MATPAGWEWDKYSMRFKELWDDDTYKDTGLPRKVPVLSAVCPSNPDLVYFALEQRLFGVNVPVHKVVEAADEAHELVNMPWPAPAFCPRLEPATLGCQRYNNTFSPVLLR